VEDTTTSRPSRLRLAFWSLFVGVFVLLAYAERSGTKPGTNIVYKYSTFVNGTIFYAVWLGAILLIAYGRLDLLALRAPDSWGRALRLASAAFVFIVACEFLVSLLPLPISPGKEQGDTPAHWEPAHAGAFALNMVLLAVIAPVVEELMFRGLGQSLLRFLGQTPSIVLVGVAFALAHGLVEGLLVLIPFGIAVAWVRDRADSVYPGMLVHAVFNGGSLALAVLVT
jgi:membrane protease YdiL (CAAX protease family)